MSEQTPPLLSLCFPTYRRAALLTEALDSVLSQLPAGETPNPWVEIVISDNASPDATADAVRQAQESRPDVCIRYFCQQENRGADANIYSALRMGRGEFLLALSDDDVLLAGALDRLLGFLRQNPCLDVLGTSSATFLTDSTVLRSVMRPVAEDEVVTRAEDCLKRAGVGVTFLSAFAVRRSLVQHRDYASRIGSNLLQTYIFLDALKAAREIHLMAVPLIGVRENNSGGYSYFEVFVTNFLAALAYAEQIGYPAAAVEEVRQTHLRRALFAFVRGASLGTVSSAPDFREGARRLLAGYGLNLFLLTRVLPLLLLPAGLLRGAQALRARVHPA